jgi:LmbE family N-acetylglucosaminyl deacetylase
MRLEPAPVPADLAARRRRESQASLSFYGVRNQIYLELPDGELWPNIAYLQQALGEVIAREEISRVVTTGKKGYDKHPDHIALHAAAVEAARAASLAGQDIEVWALIDRHEGEQKMFGDISLKLGAMALHRTQRVHPDLTLWGGSTLYTPLILGPETYDVITSEQLIGTTQTKAAD